MTGVWTFPWTLFENGIDQECRTLVENGVDTLTVASHHHSARVFQPRLEKDRFTQQPGGCYFDPENQFDELAIDPLPNPVADVADPLAETVAAGHEAGVRVNGWVVCNHSSRRGNRHPRFQTQDAFGNSHEHAFCLSHPDVREYFAAVAGAVADRGVDAVELESPGYSTAVFHGHGRRFGHDARQVLTTETETTLFSQCFCDACQAAARDHPVDLDAAADVIREVIAQSFETPHSNPQSLGDLVRERPELQALFDFRAAVVADLFDRITAATGDTDLVAYIRTDHPDWPAGITLETLEQSVDRLRVLCYVSEPSTARQQLRTLQRSTHLPLDAGVSLDPSVLNSEQAFVDIVEEIRATIDGSVSVFCHSLFTEEQLAWVSRI